MVLELVGKKRNQCGNEGKAIIKLVLRYTKIMEKESSMVLGKRSKVATKKMGESRQQRE
jgi:hypothetical protein